MQLGLIGFGKMGSRIAEKLLADGHHVVGWNRSRERVDSIKYQVDSIKNNKKQEIPATSYLLHATSLGDFQVADSLEDLVRQLTPPRVIWLMLTAGEATETAIAEVAKYVEPADIVIDGGNAHFSDTERRSKMLESRAIRFLGIGVSGGIHALTNGYPLMAGGDEYAYRQITPVLDTLSKPHGGHQFFGSGGAGHFVKMVHNGIEYGMMQAIGEGFGVMERGPYLLDLEKVAALWQKKTIVSGFLMDRVRDALKKDPRLANVDGVIAASGEGEWTVDEAHKENVPVENIEQALAFRRRSQSDTMVSDSFAAKMVAALRHEFGGHPLRRSVSEASEVKKK